MIVEMPADLPRRSAGLRLPIVARKLIVLLSNYRSQLQFNGCSYPDVKRSGRGQKAKRLEPGSTAAAERHHQRRQIRY